MKITVDTNVLVRSIVHDDQKQARAAEKLLKEAELVAVSTSCLCELVWVLRQGYRLGRQDVHLALKTLLSADNVEANRPAVDAGLEALYLGGDFADGVIAYEGSWLGGEIFVSFDKKAVLLLLEQGQRATLLK